MKSHTRFTSYRKAFCLLMSAFFLAATASVAFAQTGLATRKCAFQKLSFPPPATSANVQLAALNDVGGIAGTFVDSKNVDHGFLLFQGRFTKFMFPGSISTTVSDMSRNGIIVGGYTSKDGKEHAFMAHNGGFRTITLPGHPNADIMVSGVNSNGDVVGNFSTDQRATFPGFLLHNGKVTILSFPGALVTQPTSINDEGVVVGFLSLSINSNPAFMWKDGVFSNIKPPDSIPEPFVFPRKISNSGVVVGNYQPESGASTFALDHGTYTKLDPPAGSFTMDILAVNKFDNILAGVAEGEGNNPGLFKGFCSAAF